MGILDSCEAIAKPYFRTGSLTDITPTHQYIFSTIHVPDAGRSQNCYSCKLQYHTISHDLIPLFEEKLKNNIIEQSRFHNSKHGDLMYMKNVYSENQNKC